MHSFGDCQISICLKNNSAVIKGLFYVHAKRLLTFTVVNVK